MKNNNRCLYCYKPLEEGVEYHPNCSKKFFGTEVPPAIEWTMQQMHELADQVVEHRVAVPGVQAKLSMSVVKDASTGKEGRLTFVGALGGRYIMKPPNDQFAEMPANEHLTMRLAEAMKISVVPSSLIRLKSGELAYVSRRIDRTLKGEKIHMLDMYQITEAHDKYRSSMERVGKAIHDHSSNPYLDALFLFELTLFSFLIGNNDMHLKNFSMIQSSAGWLLSPAYDLLNVSILNPADKDETALTINGRNKNINLKHFLKLAESIGLTKKQAARAVQRIRKIIDDHHWIVDNSFLSDDLKTAYSELIAEKASKLD